MMFGIWDANNQGTQFGGYQGDHSYSFDQYFPNVPSTVSHVQRWPSEFYSSTSTSLTKFSVRSDTDLNGYGRWTACIANGAISWPSPAFYNLSVSLFVCPYSPTSQPTSQPTLDPNDMMHWANTSTSSITNNYDALIVIYQHPIRFQVSFTSDNSFSNCEASSNVWESDSSDPYSSEQSDRYLSYRVYQPPDPAYVCKTSPSQSTIFVSFQEQIFNFFVAFAFRSEKIYRFTHDFSILSWNNKQESAVACLGQSTLFTTTFSASCPSETYCCPPFHLLTSARSTSNDLEFPFELHSMCDNSAGTIVFIGYISNITARTESSSESTFMRFGILDSATHMRIRLGECFSFLTCRNASPCVIHNLYA